MIALGPADPCVHTLLALLADPHHVLSIGLPEWDKTIRLARQARLLGVLAQRIQPHDELRSAVPECVLGHLRSATVYSAHRGHLLRMELTALAKALPPELPVVVLKGAAYMLQKLDLARGRLPSDVDLMVAHSDLDPAEAALRNAGWEFEEIDAYTERYYRQWSHELPPLRVPGHPLEVDLHHTIPPVTGRLKPDTTLLFADLQALPGERFLVLHPLDQILHAVVHLFQDSDLQAHLRDLVDIDGLLRAHVHSHDDWQALAARAVQHRVERPLWYALRYCRAWLTTPVPEDLPLATPPAAVIRLFDWVFPRCTLPRIPDQPAGISRRTAARLGSLRHQWLRLPPGLLVRQIAHKSMRAWRARITLRQQSE